MSERHQPEAKIHEAATEQETTEAILLTHCANLLETLGEARAANLTREAAELARGGGER